MNDIPTLEQFEKTILGNPPNLKDYITTTVQAVYDMPDERKGKQEAKKYIDILEEYKFQAKRGREFVEEIRHLLSRAKMNKKCIYQITTPECMKEYERAFTHKSFDKNSNLEYYEFVGDGVVNNCIVQYIFNRFPHLRTPFGVKIGTRMKINCVASKNFANFDSITDMHKFVSCDLHIKFWNKELLEKSKEDVFEAFFGCTNHLVNKYIHRGVGFAVCYQIIESLFDEIGLKMKYSELYDPITRLKELFDKHKNALGQYKKPKINETRGKYNATYFVEGKMCGSGIAKIKKDAEKIAAEKTIDILVGLGYHFNIDPTYEEYGVEIDV